MTYPESEFVSCITLARMYDSSRDEIKRELYRLRERGHIIDSIKKGKQGKLKINPKQFRVAIFREYGETTNAR